ncbi:hypothetical protein [Collinsella sp. LCP19S3_A6]|uniref:hypothetical protein n=1 Tax=Collinsella sp. LCP19S3_A6 TaxID=3438752 RepID=UPI003F900828
MDEYNLAPGELIIMQTSNVRLGVGSGSEALDEIVLTNMNLILVATVSEGLFKTRRYLKRCPLDSILCSTDVPQAIAARVNSTPVLRVAFSEETITVSFTEGASALPTVGPKACAARRRATSMPSILQSFPRVRRQRLQIL